MKFLFIRRLSLEQFVATRRFQAFDGVRALAAVMVIVYHFSGSALSLLSGWLGVHVFFVLSGFLITTLLIREEAARGRVSLGDFWIRRVLRILPAYYAVLAVTVVLMVLQNQATELELTRGILWFLTVNPDLSPVTMGLYPAWTIGVEQKFYLVWPALAFVAIAAGGRRRFAVWVGALVVLLALTFFVSGSLVHYVVILLGCGVALAMHSPRIFPFIAVMTGRLPAFAALGAMTATGLAAGASKAAFGSDEPAILLFGLSAALALPGVVASTRLAAVLSWRPLTWLGERSYSLYLVQVLAATVVDALFPPRGGFWFLALTLVVAIMMADGLHRWVEVPGIELGRTWTDRRKSRRTVLAATPQKLTTAADAPQARSGSRPG